MSRYQIVTFNTKTGKWAETLTDDIHAHMKSVGSWMTGTAPARLRQELQGEPVFHGFLGPCWGGPDHPVRYENQAAYDVLSL